MNESEVWKAAAEILKGETTEAKFDQHYAHFHAVAINDGLLTLSVPPLSHQWLVEGNLWQEVDRALSRAAGQTLRARFVVAGSEVANTVLVPAHASAPAATAGPEQLEGSGTYQHLYTQIVKPDELFWGTEYFRKKWVPLLGPTLAWVIVDLRRRCYWNKKTGEKRDHFTCDLAEIARSIGVDEGTVHRALSLECIPQCPEFANPKHVMADHFIKVRKREVHERDGKLICLGTTFVIYMDEPYAPDGQRPKRGGPRKHKSRLLKAKLT